MKSVRFSDVNDFFFIDAIPNATKLIRYENNNSSFSEEELENEIKYRKQHAWEKVRREYKKLIFESKILKKNIIEAKDNGDNDELEIFNEKMFMNLVNQELYTRQMIYLKLM